MVRFNGKCAKIFPIMAMVSALFISCATSKVEGPVTPAVYVTNTKKVNILTAENISKPMDEVQLFEGTFGAQSFSFPLYINADEKGMYVSILNDVGTSMGELSYSNGDVEFNSAVFPQNMKAEYIVWDIQLAFYDFQSLKERLAKYKLDFVVENDGAVEIRKILDGKNVIEEIHLDGTSTVIKNHLRGYEYHLTGVLDE